MNQEQIDNTISLIEQRFNDPKIELKQNFAVKEGYLLSLDILKGKKGSIDIAELKTIQGSAIATLAVDYLIGECEQKVLVNVPLK